MKVESKQEESPDRISIQEIGKDFTKYLSYLETVDMDGECQGKDRVGRQANLTSVVSLTDCQAGFRS